MLTELSLIFRVLISYLLISLLIRFDTTFDVCKIALALFLFSLHDLGVPESL